MARLGRTRKENTSYKMSRVRSKDTGIERMMGRALHSAGLIGYRKNVKSILGTPDFSWKGHKVVLFCDSSFWHGYNWTRQKRTIKVRKRFWFNKIETNIKRDKTVTKRLRKDGWKVFRFWDFEIKRDPLACARKVARVLA